MKTKIIAFISALRATTGLSSVKPLNGKETAGPAGLFFNQLCQTAKRDCCYTRLFI